MPTRQDQDDTPAIKIRLQTLGQLFNSFDPSPFHDKDLDRDAGEYIVSSVDEFPWQKKLKLVIELPRSEMVLTEAGTLPNAIHNYFSYRAEETRRKIRFLLRDGRTALFVGLAFLAACTSLRQIIIAFVDTAIVGVVSESLLILGWVAMWRPIQVFLYDWLPLRHTKRLYAKLAEMTVEVKPLG